MKCARCLVPAAALCLAVSTASTAAAAQGESVDRSGTPVFAVQAGELKSPEGTEVTYEVTNGDYTAGANGHLLLGFVLDPARDSALDPGHIAVATTAEPPVDVSGSHQADTAGTSASFTLATVDQGASYRVRLRPEKKTAGSFELATWLGGDVDGDFQVDQDDIVAIEKLAGNKRGDGAYSVWADVDRNGVINGGDRERAAANLGAATRLRLASTDPLDQALPMGALTLDGLSPQGFNAVGAPVAFALSGAEFYRDPPDASLTVNGQQLPGDQLTVEPNRVTAASALVDGRNDIQFTSVDTAGRPLYQSATVWAGTNALRVRVIDETGVPVVGDVAVRVSLTDDQEVFAETTTTTGETVIANVPSRTIIVKAASGNRLGTVGRYAGQGAVDVTLTGFEQPSTVDNNDFGSGADGWNIGSAPVWIGPHVEDVPAAFAAAAPKAAGPGVAAPQDPTKAAQQRTVAPSMAPAATTVPAAKQTVPASTAQAAAAADTNNDLTLGTSGQGEQSISRTFTTDQGVTAVRLRYRFVTSEVPGGYFGSQFNDYYRVAVRSRQGGATAEANSMNGLGLAAFDYASGATAWRDATLNVDQAGDTIQVDLGVANVGDGLYDSQVVVDVVETVTDQVRPALAWNRTAGGLDLTYQVERGSLTKDTTITVYWASGAGYGNRLGASIFSTTVPKGTTQGAHGPVHIGGDTLANNPENATHLIAASSPSRVGSVRDVQVSYGPNANQAVLRATTIDITKDGLRAAGQSAATITSTVRTPADQARAMFNNILGTSVNQQKALYGPAGDAVIDVYAQRTQGQTRDWIIANATTVKSAMEAEINHQGPQNVSRHCADPATVNVLDVASGAFTASGGTRFMNSVRPRVTRFIDERGNNGCFHFEIR